jgi:peptide subunit release factor 1 (eRF1)
MSTPSLATSVHDRYSPELRDRILGKLHGSIAETPAYRLLTPAHLRALAEIESADWPVLSLYLELSPDRRTGGAWHTVFSSLRDSTLKPIDTRQRRQAVRDEFNRIEHALEAELPVLGRGAVFFTCAKLGLWRQIGVSVPLPDSAHLAPRPYLRPLVRMRDEHDRFAIALLSQELSRFFISQIGQVEEVFRVKGQRLRKMLTDRVPRDRHNVLATEAAKNEARVLAHAAELVLTQLEGRYLLLSGTPALRAAVIQHLAKNVQQRLGGEFFVDIHAPPGDVTAACEPVQGAIEEREEIATVQRLLDAGPDRSAWGEQPTLDAVREGRVMTLVVNDMFGKPGARCRNCGALWAGPLPSCPACGRDAVDAVSDVVELTIEQTLEQKSALEIVRSGAARGSMTSIGPMAALLRW